MRVVAIEPSGFALRSLPGHPEGSDRTITFEFRYLNDIKIMHVNAWGPVSGASLLGPLNSGTAARESWRAFAQNITTRFPARPPCSACF